VAASQCLSPTPKSLPLSLSQVQHSIHLEATTRVADPASRALAKVTTQTGQSGLVPPLPSLQDGKAKVEEEASRAEESPRVCQTQDLDHLANVSHPLRLSQSLQWWVAKGGAPTHILDLITKGVCLQGPPPNLPWLDKHHPPQEQEACLQILEEYAQVGAVKEVPAWEYAHLPFLVPWFILSKKEEGG
jgi:hypothetical protein